MRNCLKTIISISALVSVLGLNSSVFGVAAFARQTGLDCTSCHSSAGFPTLNTFGAAFKAGGYVNGDDANMMGDGEALSIPKNLNISVVTKVRYKYELTDSAAKSTGVGVADIPDELALMLGGRVGKNVGFILEWVDGAKTARVPIVFDLGPAKLGAVIFSTDAMGEQVAFETAATGAQRNLRAFENINGAARQFVKGEQNEAASGLGLYIHHSMFYAVYAASNNTQGADMTDKPSHYVRAAVTPNVAGLDLLVGGQYWTGITGGVQGSGQVIENNRWVADAQIMGTLGVPVLVWVNYGTADKADTAAAATGVEKVMQVGVDAQIIENKANLGLGFNSASLFAGGDAVNSVVVVGKYNIIRNLRANVEYGKGLTKGAESSFVQAMLFGSW